MEIKPHGAWFLAGPAIFVLGCVVASIVLVVGIANASEGLQRVPIPGESTVTFDRAGDYTVFIEQEGAMDVRVPPDLAFEITPVAGGAPLEQKRGGASFTYRDTQAAGRNVCSVYVPAPGEYRVVSEGPPGTRLAMGSNPAGRLVAFIFGFFALVGLSAVAAALVIALVAVKRSRYRKAQMARSYT